MIEVLKVARECVGKTSRPVSGNCSDVVLVYPDLAASTLTAGFFRS